MSAQKLNTLITEIALANKLLRIFVEETDDMVYDKALEIMLQGFVSDHEILLIKQVCCKT